MHEAFDPSLAATQMSAVVKSNTRRRSAGSFFSSGQAAGRYFQIKRIHHAVSTGNRLKRAFDFQQLILLEFT
jgi:hypothetical protein